MSAIAGIFNYLGEPVANMEKKLRAMNELQKHRGTDGEGKWIHDKQQVGMAQRVLKVLKRNDVRQPFSDGNGNWLCFSGGLSNHEDIEKRLGLGETLSVFELVMAAYCRWGKSCVDYFSGVFAFALWDEEKQELFCARDQFGVKPFYYLVLDGTFYFANEMKTLLPFMDKIETDPDAFNEYVVFQFCIEEKTLFKGIKALPPAHRCVISANGVKVERYWEVYYQLDLNHTEKFFVEKLQEIIFRSVKRNLESDVPIGGFVSGGIDSSITASLASEMLNGNFEGFVGKYAISPEYDESEYAQAVADAKGFELHQIDITCQDFIDNIGKVIYQLDTPVGGPGSFSEFMSSGLAAKHVKVAFGGEGGDEIFGGYTRYLVAYFEECIKGAIEGTMDSGNYIVTYESIIPNLKSLRNYKPMIKSFWKEGLFEPSHTRYYQLINRAPLMEDCLYRERMSKYNPYTTYERIFVADNVDKKSYLDRMTHFDFKTLLPALLQVDDRMSMAHGLETRVPLLDKELVEFAATIPANFKMKAGRSKYILRKAMSAYVPDKVMNRQDKMGFPTPFAKWAKKETRDFIMDILSSQKAKEREFINNDRVISKIDGENSFARNLWGFFCIELWQQTFHDRASEFKKMII